MKKLIKALMILLMVTCLVSCQQEEKPSDAVVIETPSADALKFKDEYEVLNGTIREKDGKTIRSIEIPSINPIVYASAEEVADKIEAGETIFIYFGFSDCPWCRSTLPYALQTFNERGIKTVYYVDVKSIRDTITYDEVIKHPVTTVEGSDGYYRLLELLDDVLADYSLSDKEGKSVDAYEKRIYAPNFVLADAGKGKALVEGISELQTNGYMELSEEMIEDMKKQINGLIDLLDSCSIHTKC